MRKLFAEHHAIVLAGHVHKNSQTYFNSPAEGTITQITISSMQVADSRSEFPESDTVYLSNALQAAMEKEPNIKAVMNEYLPFITRFERFEDGAFAVIKVDGPSVALDLYRGNNNKKPNRTWILK